MPNQIYEVVSAADGTVLYTYAALNATPYPTAAAPKFIVSYFATDQVAAVIPPSLKVKATTTDVPVPTPTGFWIVLKDGVQIARVPADSDLEPDATSNADTTVVFMNQWNPGAWVSQLHDIVVIRECCLLTPAPIKF